MSTVSLLIGLTLAVSNIHLYDFRIMPELCLGGDCPRLIPKQHPVQREFLSAFNNFYLRKTCLACHHSESMRLETSVLIWCWKCPAEDDIIVKSGYWNTLHYDYQIPVSFEREPGTHFKRKVHFNKYMPIHLNL